MQRNSHILLRYAGLLLAVGLASALYSAADGRFGWNSHGVSGLIACGGAAVLAAIFGILAGKGKSWAAWAGLALAFLLLSYGGTTLFKNLRDAEGMAREVAVKRGISQIEAGRTIRYKAGIFGAMAVFSLSSFMRLGSGLRRDPQA